MPTSEFTIIGGGLAGLSLAESLVREGAEPNAIRLLDAPSPRRASNAPTVIFHPFPGRSLHPDPDVLRMAEATLDRIERWKQQLDEPPIHRTTMIRPLRDDHLAKRLRETWAGESGYPDWFDGDLVDGDALDRYGNQFEAFDSAFVYSPAFTIDLDELCRLNRRRLGDLGVDVEPDRFVHRLEERHDGWRVVAGDDDIDTRRVMLALGTALGDWFPELALRPRGGELLHAEIPEDLQPDYVVNASGHVAPRPGGGVVAGATWWDPENFDDRDSETARRDILERCGSLFPPLKHADVTEVWRGVRANFGDHQPLVGEIPELPRLDVFGAFGSKGLLRIPHHADQLSRKLTGGSSRIPELSKPDRMRADKWSPDPERIAVKESE